MENVEGTENNVIIHFDLAKYEVLYKKYFAFEWKRETSKIPYFLVITFSLVLIAIGLWSDLIPLLVIGAIMGGAMSLYFAVYLLRFRRACNKIMNEDTKSASIRFPFFLSFDDEGWEKKWGSAHLRLGWDNVNHVIENQGDLYLFDESNQAIELIATSLIGVENFEKIRMILVAKGKLKAR